LLETGGLKCKTPSGPRLTASLADRGATCRAGNGSVHHGARGPAGRVPVDRAHWSTVDRLHNPEGVCNLGRWKPIEGLWVRGGGGARLSRGRPWWCIAADEVSSSGLAGISFPGTPTKIKLPQRPVRRGEHDRAQIKGGEHVGTTAPRWCHSRALGEPQGRC